MDVAARPATADDVARILELYGPAEVEQIELREAWGIADGLADPPGERLVGILGSERETLIVGTIDDLVFGFLWAVIDDLLPQAGGEQIGVIKMIYVEDDARMVGIAEAMLAEIMAWFAAYELKRFDAIVSPGHRLAKNFFESAGFKARRITMYRRDG
jgi:ribosomal protein S18 acetylase RimI-like enzyme